ncbi:MAG: FtsX-like permease family protein, partial [bacterium]|nr:FtsX-like permease family protein [bacterium]
KKEIGIRRACGATKKDILYQFIFEALFLTIIGTLLGLFLANAITIAISLIGKLPLRFSIISFIYAIVLSFLFGLFAGIYPAKRASELDPINVLNSPS